tara:strand:- start:133 stop:444 length:312 start_codon:yes stop_codon:yes gene_type:complete
MPIKKPRCPNGSRRKPPKTGKCIKTKKRSTASQKRSFLKGIQSKSKSKTKSSSKSKDSNKTKNKGNYRSFLKCEMKRLKKENPNVRQASIMKMAAKNWNKGKM